MTEDKNKKTEAPHPKNNEELKKILESVEEIGGSKEAVIASDWSIKGRVSDF